MVMLFTLRMSLVTGLGPREENETINGALGSSSPSLFRILAVGRLSKHKGGSLGHELPHYRYKYEEKTVSITLLY